jgi:cytochrome P450
MMKDLHGAGLLPTFKNTESIVTAPRADHSRIRRTVAHAFSDKALREQEYIVQDYIDQLISRLTDKCTEGPQDLVRWYNYTTFDIMGDLAFGEPFGCLKEGQYHEWVQLIFNGVKLYPWTQAAVYYGLTPLRALFAPKKLVEAKIRADANAYEKVARRLGRKDQDRKDFMSYILRHNDERGLSLPEIQETAVVLIIAGSETTATFLSGFTYFLLQSPHVYQRLVSEIRSMFKTYEEMTILATQDIKYLAAVVEEAFRRYPPAPNAFPRVVPPEGAEIDGQWVPGGTTVGINQWAAHHDPSNFYRPDDFLPERWLRADLHGPNDLPAELFANDNKDSMQPFSFGPRNCIGKK